MGATSIASIGVHRQKLEAELKQLEGSYKNLDTQMAKRTSDYKQTRNAMLEGKEDIKELEKQVADSKNTFKTLSAKLPKTMNELAAIGRAAADVEKLCDELAKSADQVANGLKRAGGDLADIKAEDAALKNIKVAAGRLAQRVHEIKLEMDGLQKEPIPTL